MNRPQSQPSRASIICGIIAFDPDSRHDLTAKRMAHDYLGIYQALIAKGDGASRAPLRDAAD